MADAACGAAAWRVVAYRSEGCNAALEVLSFPRVVVKRKAASVLAALTRESVVSFHRVHFSPNPTGCGEQTVGVVGAAAASPAAATANTLLKLVVFQLGSALFVNASSGLYISE